MMLPSIARNVIPLSVCSIWRSTSAPVRSDCRYCHDQLCVGQSRFQLCTQILPLAHQFLDGTITAEGEATLTAMQSAQNFTGSMADFCTTYIDKLSEAYNYGFGVACISLVASMVFMLFSVLHSNMPITTPSRLNRPMYTKKS